MARTLRNAALLGLITLVLLEVVLQVGALVVAWSHGGGAAPQGGSDREAVLCVGDSFTYGLGASDPATTSYPAALQDVLDAAEPDRFHVVRGGYPGRDSRGVLERIDGQLREFAPRHVVILVGLNDRWRQPERLALGEAAAADEGFRLEWRTARLWRWLRGKFGERGAGAEPGFVPRLATDDPARALPVPSEVADAATAEAVLARAAASPLDATLLPQLRAIARDLAAVAPEPALRAAVAAYLWTGDAETFGTELRRAQPLDNPALLQQVLGAVGASAAEHAATSAAFADALGWDQADGIWLHRSSGRQAALVTPKWLEFGPELLAAFDVHRDHLTQVIARCRQASAEPLLVGYPNRVSFPDQAFEAIAEATGTRFLSTVAPFEEALGDRPPSALFVADGHCNDAGYRLLAELIAGELRAVR
ncbi:MAG: hypothetical protein RL562_2966 [Planctomycetota bacterium]